MVDRRTFTALLAGTLAAPPLAFGKTMTSKNVFYSAIGPELTLYAVDVDKAELSKQSSVSTAANIQYAWPHPSKRYLYVVSSSGGPAAGDVTGSIHTANAFAIDPATGALKPPAETEKHPPPPFFPTKPRPPGQKTRHPDQPRQQCADGKSRRSRLDQDFLVQG